MSYSRVKISSFLDNLIFILSILFILTLTNSIFLNQLGYYGALICLLFKFYITKKNPFSKTGLGIAILLFIAAEILSTIFSVNPEQAAHFSLKRFLLIPTLYVFVAAIDDFKDAKQFVIIYIAASTLTLIYYLFRSYEYFINDLYHLQASGPSVFQYPITSSELMSFSVLILFAFLINEKTKVKIKLLVLVLFAINILALIATYKRTGWIGTAAGIILILILSRKWLVLALIAILGVGLVFMNKTVSQVQVYSFVESKLKTDLLLNTEGRAYNLFTEDGKTFLSDFDNGLLLLKDSSLIKMYEPPAPIIDLGKWRDGFYLASLIDSRFILLKKDKHDNFEYISEFYTPGITLSSRLANGMFYALDKDSSLFIYKNPENLSDRLNVHINKSSDLQNFFIDSNYFITISNDKNLSIYSLKNSVPVKKIFEEKLQGDYEPIAYFDKTLFVSSNDELKLFAIEEGKTILLDTTTKTGRTLNLIKQNGAILSYNSKGELYQFKYPIENKLIIKSVNILDKMPGSVSYSGGKVYTTFNKSSRLYSFIDPYYTTNSTRIAFWRAGIKMFLDYPVFGVGDIDLAGLYKIYKRPYDKEIQGHLHNNYFHSLATLGAFGFIAIMFLLIKIFLIHLSNIKKLKGVPFAFSFSIGAAGAYTSFLAAGLTEYNFGDHEVITLVWFTLALSIAMTKHARAIPQVR